MNYENTKKFKVSNGNDYGSAVSGDAFREREHREPKKLSKEQIKNLSKCEKPKHIYRIKGIDIEATSRKDAIKIFNHRYK